MIFDLTLLRIIAGLEHPDALGSGGCGSIRFHDEDMADRGVRERRVGFVFQHYAPSANVSGG